MKRPIDAAVQDAIDHLLSASCGGNSLEIRRASYAKQKMLERRDAGFKDGDADLMFHLARKVILT